MEAKPLVKTKTFWACMATILGAVGGYVTGEVSLASIKSISPD